MTTDAPGGEQMTTDVAYGGGAVGTAPSPLEMRAAMGGFATGVTVVTGIEDGEPVGFACQSFASVSLDPPLVLFCADHRGRAWPRIQRSGRFTVNVLGEDQTDLCQRFGSSRGRKFEDLAWEPSALGTPSLPGVLMRVHATVETVHVAGDHDVVIGRVTGLETPHRENPMLFFRGKFGVEDQHEHVAPDLWGWGEHWG
ncbi:flavin reductase family protein [Nocardioides sp. NPDC057577]|uniref:flavin reductase family protein n=1 Tax=Nocardioides sp. NPDC057577 TaxID=3346171 RepID=UPI00366EB4FE